MHAIESAMVNGASAAAAGICTRQPPLGGERVTLTENLLAPRIEGGG